MDAGERRRQEDEGKGRSDDPQVGDGLCLDRRFQLVEVDDRLGEQEQQGSPYHRENQRDRQVMRGEEAGFLLVADADALGDTDLRAHLAEVGDRVGHPSEDADSANGGDRLRSQPADPGHVGDAVGHLDE